MGAGIGGVSGGQQGKGGMPGQQQQGAQGKGGMPGQQGGQQGKGGMPGAAGAMGPQQPGQQGKGGMPGHTGMRQQAGMPPFNGGYNMPQGNDYGGPINVSNMYGRQNNSITSGGMYGNNPQAGMVGGGMGPQQLRDLAAN